jgi:hypothetical protein
MVESRRQIIITGIVIIISYIAIIYCSNLVIEHIFSKNGNGIFSDFYYLEISLTFINLSFSIILLFLVLKKRNIFYLILLAYFTLASIFLIYGIF